MRANPLSVHLLSAIICYKRGVYRIDIMVKARIKKENWNSAGFIKRRDDYQSGGPNFMQAKYFQLTFFFERLCFCFRLLQQYNFYKQER